MNQFDFFTELTPKSFPEGFRIWRARFSETEQFAVLDDIDSLLESAPPYRPRMRNGTPMINEMSNCGRLGWYSDERGYRYVEHHPVTGRRWPPMPDKVMELAHAIAEEIGCAGYAPDACLVNLYGPRGKLNLHIDQDEADYAWPILSISLGAACIFRLGGMNRSDPAEKIHLRSGDVVALFGPSRRRYHGVEKLLDLQDAPQHAVLTRWPRINLTLRRASPVS